MQHVEQNFIRFCVASISVFRYNWQSNYLYAILRALWDEYECTLSKTRGRRPAGSPVDPPVQLEDNSGGDECPSSAAAALSPAASEVAAAVSAAELKDACCNCMGCCVDPACWQQRLLSMLTCIG